MKMGYVVHLSFEQPGRMFIRLHEADGIFRQPK